MNDSRDGAPAPPFAGPLSDSGVGRPAEPPAAVRVLVMDGQQLVRSGLARLLADDPRIRVVDVSAGTPDVPDRCRELSVDVVTTDVDLPGADVLWLIRTITATSPRTRVLVVAAVADWRVVPVISAGASGFLLKDAHPESVRSAIQAIARGEQVLCQEAAGRLNDGPGGGHRLTRQEAAVLAMVAQGAANREIAELLEIGEKTVRNYVSRLYRKLAVQNRAQIATYALRSGLVGLTGGIPLADGRGAGRLAVAEEAM
jgi:DNA-binding NarL/FixJ family response regulator